MFGDEGALTGAAAAVGRKLVRVDPADWSVHPTRKLPFRRPIDVVFGPYGSSCYVVDFGEFEITPSKGVAARAGTGVLWRLDPDFMEV
jgi:hypothetical protein